MLENWIVGLKCSSVRVLEFGVECWRVGGLVFPGLMVGIYCTYIYSACNF